MGTNQYDGDWLTSQSDHVTYRSNNTLHVHLANIFEKKRLHVDLPVHLEIQKIDKYIHRKRFSNTCEWLSNTHTRQKVSILPEHWSPWNVEGKAQWLVESLLGLFLQSGPYLWWCICTVSKDGGAVPARSVLSSMPSCNEFHQPWRTVTLLQNQTLSHQHTQESLVLWSWGGKKTGCKLSTIKYFTS